MNQPNRYGEEASGSQSPTEESHSLSALSSADSPAEKLAQRLETLKFEVRHMADVEIPALVDQEPVLTTKMTKILARIYAGNKSDPKLPKYSFEKILELVDGDIKDCDSLIASLSERVNSEIESKKCAEEHRMTIKKMLADLENIEEEPPPNISLQVGNMFKKVRKELRYLVSVWAGDREDECTDLLMSLTSAHLNEEGTNNHYVDVRQSNPEVVQSLVSNRIAIWNKEKTHIRLFV